MRINVYTEELNPNEQPNFEIVKAEYISSRTGEKMTNYGIRIFTKSHPDLHFIPGRDDDRSAITFWCGSSNRNILAFIEKMKLCAEEFNLEHHRDKVQKAASEAEIAEQARASEVISMIQRPTLDELIAYAKAMWDKMTKQKKQSVLRKLAKDWVKSETQWAKDFAEGKCRRD